MHTHMNDTAFIVCLDLKKKKKKKREKEKRSDLPTHSIFRPKGQTNLLFFLGLSATYTYIITK